MKRVFCLALGVCLLLSTVALGERHRPPLRLSGMPEDGYWKGRQIPTVYPSYGWSDYPTIMSGKEAPDLYRFDTARDDFRAAKSAGLWADLSNSAVIRAWTERLRPDVKSLVTTEDGKIIGLAWFATFSPLYWRQDAWDAAELTRADVPQSYGDLLAFLEKWLERIAEKPEKKLRIAAPNIDYVNWLLKLLLHTWEMQQYAANEEPTFNTPEFVALLERTLDVGKRLDAAEPSKNKQNAALQLFDNDSGGERYNAGREYGLSHAIPFRVTNEQPDLLRGKALVYVACANSPWLDEVIGYFEYELTEDSIRSGNNADMLTGVQPRVRDAKSPGSPSTVTAGYLADLDGYSGTVCFAPMRTLELYEGALTSFAQGELSARELAETISQPKNDPNQ